MSEYQTAAPSAEHATPSVFDDIEALKLQGDEGSVAMVEVPAYITVRKPKRHEWVRAHPGMSITTSVYLDKSGGRGDDVYLVAPGMRDHLSGDFKVMTLTLAITRQGVAFLWPVSHPDGTGRADSWGETAREAVTLAKDDWVRIAADMQIGAYRIWRALGDLPAPDWPKDLMPELLKKAFKGRVIDSVDHEVVRRLRGLE